MDQLSRWGWAELADHERVSGVVEDRSKGDREGHGHESFDSGGALAGCEQVAGSTGRRWLARSFAKLGTKSLR